MNARLSMNWHISIVLIIATLLQHVSGLFRGPIALLRIEDKCCLGSTTYKSVVSLAHSNVREKCRTSLSPFRPDFSLRMSLAAPSDDDFQSKTKPLEDKDVLIAQINADATKFGNVLSIFPLAAVISVGIFFLTSQNARFDKMESNQLKIELKIEKLNSDLLDYLKRSDSRIDYLYLK